MARHLTAAELTALLTTQTALTPAYQTGTLGGAVSITGVAVVTGPLVQVTAAAHGLVTGDLAYIVGVTGAVESNGVWTVTKTGTGTFTINGLTAVTGYSAGGTVQKITVAARARLADVKPSDIAGIRDTLKRIPQAVTTDYDAGATESSIGTLITGAH